MTASPLFVIPDQISMRKANIVAIVLLAFALAGCAKAPLEAVAAAQAAVEAARGDPDVALYAPDALRTAEQRLEELAAEKAAQERKNALVRDWDRTAELAAAARDAGAGARTAAASAKAAAGAEAASLIESATAALSAIEVKAGQARRTRGVKLDMTAVVASIVEIRGIVEAARADHAALAYASSRAKAAAAGARLAALDAQLSEAILIARRK